MWPQLSQNPGTLDTRDLDVSTLPNGRGSNPRFGVTVTLLEPLIVDEVPVAAARKVDMTGEFVRDVDGSGGMVESTPAHGPMPKETEAHGGGFDGGPSVTEFGDGGYTYSGIVGGGNGGDRAMAVAPAVSL